MDTEAWKTWELQNNVVDLSESQADSGGGTSPFEIHSLYTFDQEAYMALVEERPWKDEPCYFKSVWISAAALIKMVIHARSGGSLEVMGLMQGKGTETRVNAGAEANEYMVAFQEASEQVWRKESIAGWYHSHPGYGCWLSGIDVQTEALYQQYQDPFIAVVIDPTRTCAAGKVELKAFRCYPEGYFPPEAEQEEFQAIPANKVEDFGLHWHRYYSLPVHVFKSKLDHSILNLLWSTHWTATLVANSFIASAEYHTELIEDLRIKLNRLEARSMKHPRHHKLKALLADLEECSTQSNEATVEKLRSFSALVLTMATFSRPGHPVDGVFEEMLRRVEACYRLLPI